MRRNNHVFLYGSVDHYTVQQWHESGVPSLIDLHLRTERKQPDHAHRVLVQGRQAAELKVFFDLTEKPFPDLVILGWLYSQEARPSLVMAERVTVVVDARIRRAAAQSIRSQRQHTREPPAR